ncbi:fibronectin type III domain-containing protein [Labilibacter marinus]|uniref:fibronectin type III domain-containing protein n=1 Tax=Labilibacter marinus TaxID=1477105 RepID=UPI000829F630|nr:fibronectin type III domain-containing protein [Labilibacter marinus]
MKKLIILFTLLVITLGAWSQAVYPVRTYTVLTPPMPYTLSGFASEPGRMQLNINVDDVSLERYPVYFRLVIKGNGIKLHTKPNMYQDPFYLDGGMHEVITGLDLEPLFNPKNLIFEGYSLREYERSGRLPEGVYQVSVELWDYFHKINISQVMPGVAVMYLTRAPRLTFPQDKDEIDILSNPNLRFSWMGSMPNDPTADPVYRFNLYEIRPEGRNPYEVVRVSPPIFTLDTKQSSLIYDMGMPPLEEGMSYAWQIQSVDLEGKAKFQNDGFSEVYSFRYGKACETPEIQITKVTTSDVQLKFSSDINIQLYRIFYKTTDEDDWQSIETDVPNYTLSGLQENTGYEIKVSALCGEEESDESSIVRCKTNLDVDYTCGKIPDNFDISNTEPLPALRKFDFFKAADFSIQASEVTGENGRFSGSGFALVPYLSFVKFAVEFENIFINADRRMTEGSVQFVYDEANGLVLALDKLGKGGDNEDDISVEDVLGDATDDQIIVETEITNVTVNGNTVTVTTKDGKTEKVTVEEGQTVGVGSKTGSPVYVVDTGSGQVYTAPNPSTNGAKSSSVATPSQTGEYGISAIFKPAANQLFGFDAVPKDSNRKPDSYFNINKSGDKIAWKSLASGRAEYLEVEIKGKANDTVRYIRSSGMLAPYSKNKAGDQLLLTGMSEGEEEILTAASVKKESINDSTTNEILTEVGAIGLVSYAPIHKEVVLVPLNNAQCPTGVAGVKTALDKLYAPAIVSWTVRIDKNFDYDGLKSESFTTEGTGTSKYTRDMNKVIRAYKKARGTTKNTYYLFFVKEPQTKLAGFMPLTGEYGFIFNFGNNTNVLGHELAHGAFNLRHTFSPKADDQFTQGTTQNLMDYSNSTELWKYQWDLIHDPEKIVLALFQDEEEGASISDDICFNINNLTNSFFNDISEYINSDIFNHVANNFNSYLSSVKSSNDNITLISYPDWSIRGGSYNSTNQTFLSNTIFGKIEQNNMPINLNTNGVYIAEHTIEEIPYNTAIYCTRSPIDITKFHIDKICELLEHEYIRVSYRAPHSYIAFLNSSKQPEVIIQILNCSLDGLKVWTTYLGLFGEMSELDYWNEFFDEIGGGNNAVIDNIFEKDNLTASEISQVRELIEGIEDIIVKKDYYIQLQKKVPYYSQRDNETSPNVTCNVTSLAGALTVLGLNRPCMNCDEDCNSEETIADYLYCIGESILIPFERTNYVHWQEIAEQFGVTESERMDIWNNTNTLRTTIKGKLESGCGVLLSAFHPTGGHIVRLLDITDEGLIVDDPYGELEDGAEREVSGGNYNTNTKNSNENAGSENLWLWTDITGEHNDSPQSETYWIKYVVTFCN